MARTLCPFIKILNRLDFNNTGLHWVDSEWHITKVTFPFFLNPASGSEGTTHLQWQFSEACI